MGQKHFIYKNLFQLPVWSRFPWGLSWHEQDCAGLCFVLDAVLLSVSDRFCSLLPAFIPSGLPGLQENRSRPYQYLSLRSFLSFRSPPRYVLFSFDLNIICVFAPVAARSRDDERRLNTRSQTRTMHVSKSGRFTNIIRTNLCHSAWKQSRCPADYILGFVAAVSLGINASLQVFCLTNALMSHFKTTWSRCFIRNVKS